MTAKGITFITEEARRSILQRQLAELVVRSDHARITLSRQEGWVAVPVESASHFSELHISRLHEAWRQISVKEVFAVLIEPLIGVPEVSEVEASIDGLRAFEREFSHFNVALYSSAPRAIAICTTDDYFVVAGPEEFVALAAGGSIPRAYVQFAEFASAKEWSDDAKAFFSSIVTALRDVYPLLPPGASVTFPD